MGVNGECVAFRRKKHSREDERESIGRKYEEREIGDKEGKSGVKVI